MKKFSIILTIAAIATSNLLYGQVKKCDIDILAYTSTREYDLTEKDVKDFLSTFDKSCSVNVEYSEFSNTLLFEVLDRYTQTFISVLERHKRNLAVDYIFKELASPIDDNIDLKKLIAKVEGVKADSNMKRQIVERLEEANAKY